MFTSIKSGWFVAAAAIAGVASSVALAQSARPDFGKSPPADAGASTSAAEVVLSRVLYQRQRVLPCNSGADAVCFGHFATLSAKQRIELQHVSCFIQVNGGVVKGVEAVYSSGIALFLGLGFQSTSGADTFYTFQQATSMYIPPTKTLQILIGFNGTAAGNQAVCNIFGQLVTLK